MLFNADSGVPLELDELDELELDELDEEELDEEELEDVDELEEVDELDVLELEDRAGATMPEELEALTYTKPDDEEVEFVLTITGSE